MVAFCGNSLPIVSVFFVFFFFCLFACFVLLFFREIVAKVYQLSVRMERKC